MEKDEILSKSREENRNRDLYEIEVHISAGSLSAMVALILATVFFVTQSIMGGGFNYGLYALVISFGAVQFIVRSARLRRKRDILFASIYTAAALALSALHMIQLIAIPAA